MSSFFFLGARGERMRGGGKMVKRVKVPLVATVTIQKSALHGFCDEEAFCRKKE
jgi:hypothetical protein